MKVQDFIKIYSKDSLLQTAADFVKNRNTGNLQIKGLAGSADAVVAAAFFDLMPQHHLFVLHDREEAAYFHNDLQSLLPEQDILFFPMSYKKPYQFEEIDNANVLQRSDVLNKLKDCANSLVVTYPDALTEKVINKRSLVENTFMVRVADKLDVQFLTDFLFHYEFERSDFVYEAGQFAVRGGIIDIFSYANELPYRLELFGDEVESIRTFDPMTQLSKENKSFVSIIPNVQNKLLHETRESFLKFIPKQTRIWVKDKNLILNTLQNYFERAKENFEQMTAKTDIKIISDPKILFESAEEFQEQSKAFFMIEFGKIFSPPKNDSEHKITYFETKAQPSFNKDFVLFANHLADLQSHHVQNLITAESPKQLERLAMILAEIDPQLKFEEFNISLHEGFYDQLRGISCYTDHQLFERFHRYRSKVKYSKTKSLTLKELRTLQVGDYVTHVDYGVGRFAGLEKVEVNGKHQESIRLVYRDDDLLYVSIHALHKIAKYSGKDGNLPTLNKLGSQEWEKKKSTVKRKVKDIAKELIKLYAKRKNAKGFAFSKDTYLQAELESSFLYEDTPDQAKATFDVKNDMESPHPMDRLVCGDVGFGKTEIAIRAAFKATYDGRQVAVLVPTTILAMQHFKTFSERLKNFPCKVDYVNRFRTEKEIKRILKELAEGKIDVLIGTHRVVSQDVKFKNLGLLVIDEEQKFGVKTKERLKEMCVNIDSLTLTATPIPRTLHFSMMGARDLSVIATPPPNRQPVSTEIHPFNDVIIRDAISYEIRRGGQVFFVHNRIGDIEEIANIIMRLVPDAKICYAHGQMEGKVLEKIMLKFIEGEYDVMVSTNIIESGLDIPNANTILINRAQNFGLSDLHQMRGRVGRSNRKAFCYLLVPMKDGLSNDSRKRLSALEEFSELGDGFKVAMRDLDIRGAGNLLGAEQSGFISDLGFEMYHQILDDAVQELKEEEFASLFEKELDLNKLKEFKTDCSIETDLEILIPEEYVSNISERLQLYSQADSVKDKEELTKFTKNLEDRFGKLPDQVKDLLKTVELRWLAEKIGFEKLAIKNNSLRASFVQSEGNDAYFQSESFGKVLSFVQTHAKECRLKELQKRLILIIENVKNIDRGIRILEEILG